MSLFSWQGWGRTLLLTAVLAIIGAQIGWAQTIQVDTASVPFVVNVDATVMAEPKDGVATGGAPVQITVTGGEAAVLRLPLLQATGVTFFGTQRQSNVPAIFSNRAGKITVNLPMQSYKNAEIALYTVNGKRILRQKVYATSATANNISRLNLATGVYVLLVRGTDGKALTSRLTHSGGGLDISVAFGNGSENTSSAPRMAKTAAAMNWTIIISSTVAGYKDTAYTLKPTAGTNTRQNITLQTATAGTYSVRVSSAGTGASGSNNYAPGATVNINAGTAPSGYWFNGWTTQSSSVFLASANNVETKFIMPENAVVVTANFVPIPKYKVTVLSEGAGATGSGSYVEGTKVTINAGTAPSGQRFKEWTTESNGVTLFYENGTKFVMPANDVTITAVFQPNTFEVTIKSNVGMTGALGDGDYYPMTTVNITAGTTLDGYVFRKWTTDSDIIFANANSETTEFIMPSREVTVTVNFVRSDIQLGTFTDTRDNKTYNTVRIGNHTWMAENLNYKISDYSWCAENQESYCNKYGRLYGWYEARDVCPNGWHLSSRQEWNILFGAVQSSGPLQATSTWNKATSIWNDDDTDGRDVYGFSALPGGYRIPVAPDIVSGGGIYGGYDGTDGRWWTDEGYSTSNAYYRSMQNTNGYIFEGNENKNYGHSVRCVAD